MRQAAILALALALAGCLQGEDAEHDMGLGRRDPPVVGDAFDGVDAPWVAQVAGGCGFCSGERSFRLEGEHHSLFVLDDARVVLVEWNGWRDPPGEMHVDANVTFDRAQLRELLNDSPRARDGEVWVVRVTTGRLADDAVVEGLRQGWARGSADMQCTDAGVSFVLRHANGTVEEEAFSCGPQVGEPLTWFADTMNGLVDATRVEGTVQGRPRMS